MIVRLIINLLVIYALWQIIKFVFRLALQYWIRKNVGKTFHFEGQFGRRDSREERPVGDIRVENLNPGQPKNQNRHDDKGEYIDFEEVS